MPASPMASCLEDASLRTSHGLPIAENVTRQYSPARAALTLRGVPAARMGLGLPAFAESITELGDNCIEVRVLNRGRLVAE